MPTLTTIDAIWVATNGVLLAQALSAVPRGRTEEIITQILYLQLRHTKPGFEKLILTQVSPSAIAEYLTYPDTITQ